MSGGQSFDDAASRKLEAVYQTPDVIAQRHRTLTALELREGERVLDVGAGPGLLVADMAAVVGPTGHVTGAEISDSMLAVAAGVSPPVPSPTASPSSTATPRPCRSPTRRSTWRPRPRSTSTSPTWTGPSPRLFRVLRPGGRALILDTDWASIVWNTTDQARMDRVLAAWVERFANPHLPRSLSRRLRDAGFRIHRRDVLALLNPEYDPNTYSVANASIVADYVTGRGAVRGGDAPLAGSSSSRPGPARISTVDRPAVCLWRR
jgi:arsenite methyltransferase